MSLSEESQQEFEKEMAADWPKDADNDELLKFARDLDKAAPKLEAERMNRVQDRLKTELDAQAGNATSEATAKPIQRLLILGGGLAAGVLLVVGLLMSGFFSKETGVGVEPPHPARQVEKTYSVRFVALNAPKAPKEPLITVSKYKELFAP